ncbi:MAG: hypothetical protein HND42_03580 [Armatimonadetes bacterium]|nr:hypothetical protein [Armatimonadota bacterium]NOG92310.1 hypothetical protein [Armatimonadota bacterium]
MTAARKWAVAIGVVGLLGAASCGFVDAGWYGPAGVGLGVFVSALSIGSLAMFVRTLTQLAPARRGGGALTVLFAALKLPAIAMLIFLATKLPTTGLYCFLFTILLVYSAVVWYLAATPPA